MDPSSRTPPSSTPFHSGFCALLGRPNVGKSTLINQLVGTKVAIVTPKPQTTRNRILGIINEPSAQVVMVDTPGLSEGSGPLRQALTRSAGSAVSDADVTVVVAEINARDQGLTEADKQVLAAAKRGPHNVILALNKIDRVPDRRALLPVMAAYSQAYDLAAIVPISARTGDGLDVLMARIIELLPEGPSLFPEDMHTDQAERFLCAEMVREQLLYRTQQEVPHSSHVQIDVFEDDRDNPKRPFVHLEGRIVVERDSQKAIVIGHGGATIKAISTAARASIEYLLGCQVFLRLSVHVDPRWTTRPDALRRYGITSQEASV
jgi:GTP-binding protein Era